jgi:hypothetical protein
MSSKLNKYQNSIIKFMKTNSFLTKISDISRKIFLEHLDSSEHILPVLCLTIMSSQIKNNNYKSYHGYFLASGIDCLESIIYINNNRTYYNQKYGTDNIDNAIIEVFSWFNILLDDNIELLRNNQKKSEQINKEVKKIKRKSNEYILKYLPNIVKKNGINTKQKMKKTDIISYDKKNIDYYKNYKTKNRLSIDELNHEVEQKYGSITILSILLGWILGGGSLNNDTLSQLEDYALCISNIIKIYNDFKNFDIDILSKDKISYSYLINCGVREAYIIFIKYKTLYIEKSMLLKLENKTTNDILNNIEKYILKISEHFETDFESNYDEVSSFSVQQIIKES